MISRAGKVFNTACERRFDEFQRERGLGLIQNRTIQIRSANKEGIDMSYTFQLDFARPDDSSFDVDVEIDGDGHSSKNDDWKDAVKAGAGLKVIHIPGELTKPRWWDYLAQEYDRAIMGIEKVVYISA
jgi:hypothetical protein